MTPLGTYLRGAFFVRKHFPNGSNGIQMRKGGVAHAVVCRFCLYACLNDDYTYHHLLAIHLNIQWGCGICFGFVNGYLSKIREHVQSHQKKSSRERSRSSHKKDEGNESESSSDGILSNKEELIEYKEDDGEWSGSDIDEISPDVSDSD